MKLLSRVLIVLGVVVLLVWIGRVGLIARALVDDLAQVQSFVDAPQEISVRDGCTLVQRFRRDVVSLKQEAGGVVSLAPVLGWLPIIGGDLKAAPNLLATADGLTEAGTLTCSSLASVLDKMSTRNGAANDFLLEELTNTIAVNQANLNRAASAAERAQSAWAAVDQTQLSASLARRTKLLDRGLPLIRTGLSLLPLVSDLIGAEQPRTYLLLAQNEDELRATGGFITGVGEVRIQNGEIISMTFHDSYGVDDFSQPYPYPPEPLLTYMQAEQWVFRDSNWSPDFPTAARQAIELYRPGYKVNIDGVIAVDQFALKQLVTALQPLTVKGTESPITGDNVIAYVRSSWQPPDGKLTGEWWLQRKSFMGPLAEAAWERIKNKQFNPVKTAQIILQILDQKHLLIYMRDDRAEQVLAQQGWTGALAMPPGDGLMVVDANLGYNKANIRIQEALMYQVDLRSPAPQATLTLVYTHTSSVNYPCKSEVRNDPVYEQASDRCYYDYIRVYAAPGSQLIDATSIPIPGSALPTGKSDPGTVTAQQAPEQPWTMFQVMSVFSTATTHKRVFTWALPTGVVRANQSEGEYSLRVYKQPGTLAYPLTVSVRLPTSSTLVDTLPAQIMQVGDWVIFRSTLERDQNLTLHWRKQTK